MTASTNKGARHGQFVICQAGGARNTGFSRSVWGLNRIHTHDSGTGQAVTGSQPKDYSAKKEKQIRGSWTSISLFAIT